MQKGIILKLDENTKPLQGVYEYDVKSEFLYFLYEGFPSSPRTLSSSFRSYHIKYSSAGGPTRLISWNAQIYFSNLQAWHNINIIPAGILDIYRYLDS